VNARTSFSCVDLKVAETCQITLVTFFIAAIRKMARVNQEIPTRESVRELEKKLEKCRNQENNPDSTM